MTTFVERRERYKVYYRVTGKQSVERLDPLFQTLSSEKVEFVSVATGPDLVVSSSETKDVLANMENTRPLIVWETTCEKELKPLHQQALVYNKMLNSQILESKANFAFLQVNIPSCADLTTFIAQTGREVIGWAERRWSSYSGKTPSTSDWWVIKASSGNGGRDIWMVHAQNYVKELADLPETQEYVIQKYIASPMLFEGTKKFHFRCYSLMRANHHILDSHGHQRHEAWLYQNCFILTAGLDYDVDSTDAKKHVSNLSVNKHLPRHPGQIPCHLPSEYPELYPRIQQLWLETVLAASPFMQQPSSSPSSSSASSSTRHTFEFCGIDIIADTTGRCWLLEINRLPGLESSHINTAQEDVLYDTMMTEVLVRFVCGPVVEAATEVQLPEIEHLWDLIPAPSDETSSAASTSSRTSEQDCLVTNLLRWKMFTRRHRQQLLAAFH